MFAALVAIIGWAVAVFMIAATVLLALNKQSGLTMLQHRSEMLPQAMFVRYAALAVLALTAAMIGAPRLLFAMLLIFAVIGLGDAYIYRRAGHPFLLHLVGGASAAFGAIIVLFAIP